MLPLHTPIASKIKGLRLSIRRLWPVLLLTSVNLPLAASQLSAQTNPSSFPALKNQASYTYRESGTQSILNGQSNLLNASTGGAVVIDPFGQVLGCGGKLLPDYTGFVVGMYQAEPQDPAGNTLGPLVSMTTTELPDIPGNNIPKGIAPNITNLNPYALTNGGQGRYSFLFDRTRGQVDPGSTYILVVTPPANSTLYVERRIRLEILSVTQDGNLEVVAYRATSLDGQPITTTGQTQLNQNVVLVPDAEKVGLEFLATQFTTGLCNQNQIQITKSGDRASAAVGDTVVYRLSIRNPSDASLDTLSITDKLPTGFQFLPDSVRASLNSTVLPVTVDQQGLNLTFNINGTLPENGVVNLVYAARLTADAIRGDGQNLASVSGQRVDNDTVVRDGPAVHRVRPTPGILSDCGTIIGRVFEDRNFDGEQQDGEPGIPNAVVFMEDGNRIVTDPNGLYSVKCVLPGYHTGVLDPTSIPGYRLAPNQRFIERNSPSRLVKLAPGSMVRMNFGVTPTGRDGGKQ